MANIPLLFQEQSRRKRDCKGAGSGLMSYARTKGNTPDTVCGEAGVERQRALLGESLHCAINAALVRHRTIGERLHLLNPGLDEVEWQTGGRERGGGREGGREGGRVVSKPVRAFPIQRK